MNLNHLVREVRERQLKNARTKDVQPARSRSRTKPQTQVSAQISGMGKKNGRPEKGSNLNKNVVTAQNRMVNKKARDLIKKLDHEIRAQDGNQAKRVGVQPYGGEEAKVQWTQD